jgi:hypothetical protein
MRSFFVLIGSTLKLQIMSIHQANLSAQKVAIALRYML